VAWVLVVASALVGARCGWLLFFVPFELWRWAVAALVEAFCAVVVTGMVCRPELFWPEE
jgi:hypothetical protein